MLLLPSISLSLACLRILPERCRGLARSVHSQGNRAPLGIRVRPAVRMEIRGDDPRTTAIRGVRGPLE